MGDFTMQAHTAVMSEDGNIQGQMSRSQAFPPPPPAELYLTAIV